jgi:hypothetical protein
MQFNPSRLTQFLELAGRATSNENEALIALRMARTELSKGDLTFADLEIADDSVDLDMLDENRQLKADLDHAREMQARQGMMIESLHDEKHRLLDRLAKSEETVERLKALRGAGKAIRIEGDNVAVEVVRAAPKAPQAIAKATVAGNEVTYEGPAARKRKSVAKAEFVLRAGEIFTFAEFEAVCTVRLEMGRGWIMSFCDAAGVRDTTVQRWKQKNAVPREAMLIAGRLQPAERKVQAWTPEMYKHMHKLLTDDRLYSMQELVDAFAKKFKVNFSLNSVKSVKRRFMTGRIDLHAH